MSNDTKQDDLVIRYFFGELDEAEASGFEQDWLSDNVLFERLLSIEQSLIDDFAKGGLSEPQRKKVESFLESSGRRELEQNSVKVLIDDLSKVETVTDPASATVPAELPKRWRLFQMLLASGSAIYNPSFALTGLALAAGAGLICWNLVLSHKVSQLESVQLELANQNRDLKLQLDSQGNGIKDSIQQVEGLTRRDDQIESEVDRVRDSIASATQRDTVALALSSQVFDRSGGRLREARIGPRTKWVQVTVDVGGDHFTVFRATLKSFEEHIVWSKDNISLIPKHGRLILMIPAQTLVSGDYTLTLKDQKKNGLVRDYYFRTKK